MNKIFYLSVLAISIFTMVSCEKEDKPKDDENTVTYTNTIKAELASCAVAGCHEVGNAFGSFANYDDVKATIERYGKDVVISSLRQDGQAEFMPQNQEKWVDSRIDQLEAWIEDGMPE